jgi:hypothetical protein
MDELCAGRKIWARHPRNDNWYLSTVVKYNKHASSTIVRVEFEDGTTAMVNNTTVDTQLKWKHDGVDYREVIHPTLDRRDKLFLAKRLGSTEEEQRPRKPQCRVLFPFELPKIFKMNHARTPTNTIDSAFVQNQSAVIRVAIDPAMQTTVDAGDTSPDHFVFIIDDALRGTSLNTLDTMVNKIKPWVKRLMKCGSAKNNSNEAEEEGQEEEALATVMMAEDIEDEGGRKRVDAAVRTFLREADDALKEEDGKGMMDDPWAKKKARRGEKQEELDEQAWEDLKVVANQQLEDWEQWEEEEEQ